VSQFEIRARIAKVAVEEHLVFGWAYVTNMPTGEQVLDNSDEYILIADLELAAYDYVMASRAASLLHTQFADVDGAPLAECCESMMFTPEKIAALGVPENVLPLGWWVGFKVHDQALWEAIKSGDVRAFSIGGTAMKNPGERVLEPTYP